MSGSDSLPRYPTAVIVLHWTIAAAVVGLVVLGWWMQTIPKQPVGPRADAYNLHKSIGLAALLLMAVRLAWRASHRPPELPSLPLWQARAAVAVHLSLYALMFIAALSGYLGSATSGYPVKFFGWVLPSWAGANDAIKDACSLVHLASNWLLGGSDRRRTSPRRSIISGYCATDSSGGCGRPAGGREAYRERAARAERSGERLRLAAQSGFHGYTCQDKPIRTSRRSAAGPALRCRHWRRGVS